MTVETRDIPVETDEHVVHFYEHELELLGAVAPYLSAAVRAGESAIVIATEEHRRAFETRLMADGVDLARARTGGRFIALDAAATIATFTSAGGDIDRDAFHDTIGGLVHRAAERGHAVRAYGEMVALLWDAGEILAAIELETLWNDLARELSFSLLCSYPASSVSGSEHVEALHQVCHLHSSIVHPWGEDEHLPHRSLESEVTAEFAAERDAPGQARRMVVDALRRAGLRETLVHDTALVLSELASNAVVHAGSPFSISVRWSHPTVLRVAVRDARPLVDATRADGLIPRVGHGLGLIDALTARWGTEVAGDGKIVWAELHR